jgi:hypothetical protein
LPSTSAPYIRFDALNVVRGPGVTQHRGRGPSLGCEQCQCWPSGTPASRMLRSHLYLYRSLEGCSSSCSASGPGAELAAGRADTICVLNPPVPCRRCRCRCREQTMGNPQPKDGERERNTPPRNDFSETMITSWESLAIKPRSSLLPSTYHVGWSHLHSRLRPNCSLVASAMHEKRAVKLFLSRFKG